MAIRSTAARGAAAAASAMASHNLKRSVGSGASDNKRRRFVPAPLDEDETNAATPRYTLRQRATNNHDAASTSSVKIENDLPAIMSTPSPKKKKLAVKNSPEIKKEKDPFAPSPRKTTAKPIKLELDASEARTAPKRWKEQYEVLIKQRRRIIAPVDTMGCQENGKEEKREDQKREEESEKDKARRERFTILVSLMLSSQTKDPVTAEAVHNLQRNLPNGLSLNSILEATQDDISTNICKVGFWRRKTGYIQSAARIIRDDFDGDIPQTIDDLCSLPGVGPKMGFLALQGAWGLNVGIGVDVHVHRVANRLKWVNSNDPEGTRLQLQSWLPKEMHPTINKTLVGFGQVICQPVGPRCDLCALGSARLCASYRKVDPKSIASRVKVELLPDIDEAALKVEGPDGQGSVIIKEEDSKDLDLANALLSNASSSTTTTTIKTEEDRLDW